MEALDNYYAEQAGSGIAGFEGVRYQRGNGFFGRIFSSAVMPLLKYFGRNALEAGTNIASDVLEGKNVKEAFKEHAKATGKKVAKAGIDRARKYAQDGKGKRQKKRGAIKGVAKRRKPKKIDLFKFP